MDLCSHKIVGWSLGTSMSDQLVSQAMQMAIDAKGDSGLMVHYRLGPTFCEQPQSYINCLKRLIES